MDRDRITLRPTIEDLNRGDPYLQEMIRFIKFLVERDTDKEVAHNASLAYLALVTAFQQAGLVEAEWAPVLSIDLGDVEYELCTAPKRSQSDFDMESSASESSNISDDTDSRAKSDIAEQKQGQVASSTSSKSEALLGALLSRVRNRLLFTRLGDYSQHATSANASGNPATLIAQKMYQLDALDRRSHALSVSINLCYFAIGGAYRRFAQDMEPISTAPLNQRAEQSRVLQALWSALPESSEGTAPIARATPRKRLQRARKFVALVDIFGKEVLYLAPEVSVSRVDAIKLSDVQKMASESTDRGRIMEIKAKMVHLEEDDRCQESSALVRGSM